MSEAKARELLQAVVEAHPFSYVGEDECGYCNLPREHPIHWRAAPAAEPVAQQPPPRDVEADARRYRWLRLNGGRYSTEYGSVDLLGELGEGEIDSDALDAAIDAEMSAKAPTDANRSA